MHVLHRRDSLDFSLTPISRVLLAGRTFWFYAAKLHWPAQLTATYPRWEIDVHDPQDYLHVAAALAMVVGLWKARPQVGKGRVEEALEQLDELLRLSPGDVQASALRETISTHEARP